MLRIPAILADSVGQFLVQLDSHAAASRNQDFSRRTVQVHGRIRMQMERNFQGNRMCALQCIRDDELVLDEQVIYGSVPSKSNCYRIITLGGHGSLAKTSAMKEFEKKFYLQCGAYRNRNIISRICCRFILGPSNQ